MLPKKYILDDDLVPDVRDQKKLDICVAMAITAVMQSMYWKETGERRQFSPTFAAVWRDEATKNMKSLVPETALKYAVQLGCPFEDDVGVLLQNPEAWEYVESHKDLYTKAEKIIAYWEKVSGTKAKKTEALKKAVYENQLPAVIVVKEKKSSHCVPLVGWDDEAEFFTVMNSWGNGIDYYKYDKLKSGYILYPRAVEGENMSVKKYSLAKDGEKSLSKNFKVKEFRCKDGSDEILISDELVDLLQNIRDYFGKSVVITSAYRTKTHNTKCGGATKSQHILGTAADIKIAGVDPLTVARYAEMVLGEKGGIGYYYNKNNFTHVDVRSKKARWQNGGTGDVSVKNHGMVEVGELVTELGKRGIITDIALWTKRLKEDNNAYWLVRKAAVLTKNKAVPTGHGEIKTIVNMLNNRGIITNVRLWNDILPEDVNLYWLAYKICNMTE